MHAREFLPFSITNVVVVVVIRNASSSWSEDTHTQQMVPLQLCDKTYENLSRDLAASAPIMQMYFASHEDPFRSTLILAAMLLTMPTKFKRHKF